MSKKIFAITIVGVALSTFLFINLENSSYKKDLITLGGKANKTGQLTSEELEVFTNLTAELNFNEVLKVLTTIEQQEGEVVRVGNIYPGTPKIVKEKAWEAPALILVNRLLDISPPKAIRLLEGEVIKERAFLKLSEQAGKRFPKLAWEETKRYYEYYGNQILKRNLQDTHRIPNTASQLFKSYQINSKELARQYLLEKEFKGFWYLEQLQEDALVGMLLGCKTEEEFIEYLEWILSHRQRISDNLSYLSRFDLEFIGDYRISSLALASLAKENPERAIKWATYNKYRLDFDWKLSIYGGWISFWADTPDEVEAFNTKRVDAFGWLSTQVTPDSMTSRKAYHYWKSVELKNEISNWLNISTNDSKVKITKDYYK